MFLAPVQTDKEEMESTNEEILARSNLHRSEGGIEFKIKAF